MTLLHDRRDANGLADAEAHIREARRVRRSRSLRAGFAVVVALATGLGVTLSRGTPHPGTRAARGGRSSRTTTVTYVAPESPQDLAASPNGDLYVVDSARDQILRWIPGHGFVVVAGNGHRGYSGDGGPAVDAEIHLEYDAGIAVGPNGTVYFSDSWNARVRAILPDGRIETIVGGGTLPLGTHPVDALKANLGTPFTEPAGLAIGPDGDLYIGLQDGVYRLDHQGDLEWVVGKSVSDTQFPKNWGGVYSNPAIEQDFQPAVWLAFDRSGDLYVAGGGGWGLYEKTTNGMLRFLGTDRRPGGFWGSLTNLPNGTVAAIDSAATPDPFLSVQEEGALGKSLGELPQALPNGSRSRVFAPNFVTYARSGTFYVDDIAGAALPTVPAIAMVKADSTVTLLWKGTS
jgi:hypothetical protein